MPSHFDYSDEQFENLFALGNIADELFTHEAHIRLAWIHLLKYGETKAIENITHQIKAFTIQLNETEKYNHTLTIASIKVINHFRNKSKSRNFEEFLKEFPRLKTHFKELLQQHYSAFIFTDATAKVNFLQPDLTPFA